MPEALLCELGWSPDSGGTRLGWALALRALPGLADDADFSGAGQA
ncbi:hypothetical protein [Streptomyces sp. NPDC094472]